MSCGCTGGQSTPPDSTPGATSLPSGAGSSYGAGTTIPGSCSPSVCPTPKVNNEVGRDPYCPGWVSQVLSAVRGKLFIRVGDCIHFLRSKCTGVVWYDATTEEVSVKDAPFVESTPKQTVYGWLAKVRNVRKPVCDDNTEDCAQVVKMELAAQVMQDAQYGDLVISQTPLCGELPLDESADAEKQVAFHRLSPTDIDCPPAVKILVAVEGFRGTGPNRQATRKWHWLNSLKLRRSQWKQAIAGSTDESASFLAVLVPVAGGNSEDPCYELRLSEQKPGGGVPSTANNCDMLVFKDKGLATAGWRAIPRGLGSYKLSAPSAVLITHAGPTANFGITLPEFPTADMACGKIEVELEVTWQAFAGPSSSGTNIEASMNGWSLGACGFYGTYVKTFVSVPVTVAGNTVNFTKTGTGTASMSIRALGYRY